MKIVFVVTRVDEIGGAQIHVRDMACKLSSASNKVWILSGKGIDPAYYRKLLEHKVIFVEIASLKRNISIIQDIKAYKKLYEIIKHICPDILSLHSSKAGFIGRIIGKKINVRTVFTAHGWSFSEGVGTIRERIFVLIEKFAARYATKIISVSEYDKKIAVRYRITRNNNIVVIRNGVKDIRLEQIAKPDIGKCRLVMTARFSPPKDHSMLLNTLSKITTLDWYLDLIGTGRSLYNIQKLTKKLKIEGKVFFHGQISDVEDILSKSSIFVIVTKWEGLPRSIIEAMRAGLPVVASKVGGVPELVKHGVNGYLIPRGDSSELLKRVEELVANCRLRRSMGSESRTMYEKNFTFQRMYSETVKLYREILTD